MIISIEVPNLAKMEKGLKLFPKTFIKYADIAIRQSIFQIQREAVPLTPVDTGRLKASYSSLFSVLRGVLEPQTTYAYWVNVMDNNKHKTGQSRFMETGVEKAKPKINDFFGKAIENAFKEITK